MGTGGSRQLSRPGFSWAFELPLTEQSPTPLQNKASVVLFASENDQNYFGKCLNGLSAVEFQGTLGETLLPVALCPAPQLPVRRLALQVKMSIKAQLCNGTVSTRVLSGVSTVQQIS